MRDRLHNDASERAPVPFVLREVGRRIWGGCRERVVMQSASGRKLANEKQEHKV